MFSEGVDRIVSSGGAPSGKQGAGPARNGRTLCGSQQVGLGTDAFSPFSRPADRGPHSETRRTLSNFGVGGARRAGCCSRRHDGYWERDDRTAPQRLVQTMGSASGRPLCIFHRQRNAADTASRDTAQVSRRLGYLQNSRVYKARPRRRPAARPATESRGPVWPGRCATRKTAR